ncbi:Imm50 family immunity protein [Streptomyces triticirhizae]|uniref:Uncharacterized protein n=1 Tax=Streptomyces triticirhizae TaxID=2483353 RepID=A0A3M2L6Q0_9ACTN|nr:Imm50 family immunity protein [Streptomyces triticirhizae]RMI33197.1 hypothetical protein EBN88_24450 [Streptomyces triticirhizae]
MTPTWAELLVDREPLARYYGAPPPLNGVVLRSVRLERDGPTLLLRLDLPAFPDRPEPEWSAAGCDRFQCQLRCLDVAEVRFSGWPLGRPVDLGVEPVGPPAERRIAVTGRQDGVEALRFSCNASLAVGHLLAYREGGPHLYVGAVDRHRLGTRLPDPTDGTFYGRL